MLNSALSLAAFWFISFVINLVAIEIATASTAGPTEIGVRNRVHRFVLYREYLPYGWYDNIVRVVWLGGFLAWIFFAYILILDKREENKAEETE